MDLCIYIYMFIYLYLSIYNAIHKPCPEVGVAAGTARPTKSLSQGRVFRYGNGAARNLGSCHSNMIIMAGIQRCWVILAVPAIGCAEVVWAMACATRCHAKSELTSGLCLFG